MTAKTIDTLVADIYDLFDPNKTHEPNEGNLTLFTENLKELLRVRLREREPLDNPLRFSSLGKQDRQLWHMARGTPSEELSAKTYLKFLYGDVIEQLVLFLARESGHSVTDEQREVEVDGVKGHIDAVIDGYLVDVKSASPMGYSKFVTNTVHINDTFGYVQQLAGYGQALNLPVAWLAFDKVAASMCVTHLSSSIVKDHPVDERINHLKEVIVSKEPPPHCYEDEEDGKSGNRKLKTGCSYCAYKHSKECWPNLRTFSYSNGPRYLTRVVKTPDVKEITS